MVEGPHLTKEWLKMYLLGEVVLGTSDADHLVGCSHCMTLLSEAAVEISDAGRGAKG